MRNGAPAIRRRLTLAGAALVLAIGGLACSSQSAAAADRSVAVVVMPRLSLADYADRGAVGIFVPGAGSTVSRERALASLVRGRVVSSLVGLEGQIELELADRPGRTTVYLELPPSGPHHNVVRYPVAIVGPGYHGLLHSSSTRIDGLVSLADIAPTARAIAAGEEPPIRARPSANAVASLARLDAMMARAHDARTGATLVLVGWLVLFATLGVLARTPLAGRAAVLVAPVALTVALGLRAVGVDEPATVIAALGVATGLGAILLALRRALLLPAVCVFLGLFLVVLVRWPEVNALAAIGPHPDGGGRFYGITNEVETLLLAPSFVAAALAGGGGAVAIGLLLILTVGWSRAGADGGGVLVVAAAFAALLAGVSRIRVTPFRLVVGLLGVAAVGLALVGVDSLLGGSSHVTAAVSGGPSSLVDDLGRRLQISWAGATSKAHTVFLCLLSLGGLSWLGIRGRRQPVIVAMLVAIGISLLVNDSPVDVLGYGALGCLALTAWTETHELSESSGAWRRLRVLPWRRPR